MLVKSFKYRIYPTRNQRILIEKHFGCSRFVYNWALNNRIQHYQQTKKTLDCFTQINQLPKLKKELPWLTEVGSNSLQQTVVNLDKAFTRFFRERNGFPKFKSKHRSKQAFQFPQGGARVDFKCSHLHIRKI